MHTSRPFYKFLAGRGVVLRLMRPGEMLLHLALLLLLLGFIFPFYWMVSSSLKPLADVLAVPVQFWPQHPTANSYLELFGLLPSQDLQAVRGITFLQALLNSFIISLLYTVFSVFLASLAGYAFAKLKFKGSKFLFTLMLVSMMIPGSVGLIPNYIIMAHLKWINTWWPLIIPGLATPFAIFWMRQYMTSIPDEMLDAAQIDGAGPFSIFYSVVAPAAAPGIAALAVFNFLGSWNAFQAPLIYLTRPGLFTITLFMNILYGGMTSGPTPFHLVFAAACISVLPILALFLGVQRVFIAGITAGSVNS